MEINKGNIHVLLQAAEYLERREREAEHGYASASPFDIKGVSCKRNKHKNKTSDNTRSVHNELEKHRRAQLRQCLEQLKQQVPLSSDSARHTTLNLLRRARLHIKKLQEQEERARVMKEQLRWEQRGLRVRLEQLLGGTERVRNDSMGSAMSSERSDSDREDVEVDVESVVFVCLESDGLGATQTEGDHSYSSPGCAWL
ncbi:max dimerization protein 3 [Brienomyrus brachyistius]|uniref:max dimerization protein 3 n=1 Tax=Brienomyrus brachyistius TaxID=42636 RepID=UPI0020B36703|nr:max dimerization protein 3 [Brienomyrus brachyistius]